MFARTQSAQLLTDIKRDRFTRNNAKSDFDVGENPPVAVVTIVIPLHAFDHQYKTLEGLLMKQLMNCLIFTSWSLTGLLVGAGRADEVQQREFFESRIRPVLIKHCYECHSADAKEIKGGLRLDFAAGLLRGGDSGSAIVPRRLDESLLIEAIRYEGYEMPPAGRLPEKIITDFEQWVELGAFDPRDEVPAGDTPRVQRTINIEAGRQFWSFQPITRYDHPKVSNYRWPTTDIDAFVLAKLEDSQLQPMPDADRRTLIRRLYIDLIGLPPTPDEVHAWLQDKSENAWEKLVDRLLQSEQFGVHWGRHWLDVARYADSNGGDFNATFHNAWRYRDYVIRSFNDDKPFDQFVREQIAGDLLPSENDAQRAEQIVATGFLMIGAKMLSERDKLKLTMDVVDEQVNTVGQAFMGLTLGCARCHDHKFDPIPTRDYYAMAGIFRSTRTLQGESQQYVSTWPRRELPTNEEQHAAVQAYEESTKKLQGRITQAQKQVDSLKTKLENMRAGEQALLLDDADAKHIGSWKASTFSPSFVGKGYIHDDRSEKGEKWVEFTVDIPKTAVYDVQLSYTPGNSRAANVPISIRFADGEREVTLDQRPKPPIKNLFASVGRFRFRKEQPAAITVATRGTTGYVIVDAIRLIELDQLGKPVKAKNGPANDVLENAEAQVDQAAAQLKNWQNRLSKLEDNAPAPLPKAIAVDEAKVIGDCEICVRGEHENLGPAVPRGVVQVALTGSAPKFGRNQSGRLELANWIASNQHPLTARVMINRIWYHLFGQGIVTSVDNFGQLGDRPSHPELLDRLAADFKDDHWSVKRAIRQIVLSRVYRLSSRHDESSWATDPENRLLWRANRRRLPAESIRDSMLAISGQLDLSAAGSPVEGLGTLVTQNTSEQKKFEPDKSVHRSAFLPMIRNEIPPILAVFDFADPDLVTGRRAVTNVPAQALLLLNSPFVMEQAEAAARQILSDAGRETDSRALVDHTYEQVLSRLPTPAELDRALQFLQSADGGKAGISPLAQLIHTLFASTEFRMLN